MYIFITECGVCVCVCVMSKNKAIDRHQSRIFHSFLLLNSTQPPHTHKQSTYRTLMYASKVLAITVPQKYRYSHMNTHDIINLLFDWNI